MRRAILSLLVVAAAAHLAWSHLTRSPVRAFDAPPQALVVPPGASVGDIGRELQRLGLVRHPLVFRALATSRRVAGRLRAGEYSLEGPLSLADIVDKLARGDVVRREVTFPEGKNVAEMAAIAADRGLPEAAFLAAASDPAPIRDLDPRAEDLEGYLFPDTYDVPRGEDAARVLVGRMLRRFRDVVEPELPGLRSRGLSLREVVTLASLVELETARAEERPRVAAVFLNRLERRMPLQTDPTVIYALRRAGAWNGNIRRQDLDVASPYNTYRNPGLPPGPIASPGRASILAVLHPAPVEDLYFVSRNDGTHHFSPTLAEHQRAVDYYQRRRGTPPGPRQR